MKTLSTVKALWTTTTLPPPQKRRGRIVPLPSSTQPALSNHCLFGCPSSSHGELFRKHRATRKPCPSCPCFACLSLVGLTFDFHCELFGHRLIFLFSVSLQALGAAVWPRALLCIAGCKRVLPPSLPSIWSCKHSLGNGMKKSEDSVCVSIALLMVCRIFLGHWGSVVHLKGFLHFQKPKSKYGLSHTSSLMIWAQPTAGSEMPVYIRR